jgi:hypothetical protein
MNKYTSICISIQLPLVINYHLHFYLDINYYLHYSLPLFRSGVWGGWQKSENIEGFGRDLGDNSEEHRREHRESGTWEMAGTEEHPPMAGRTRRT